MPPAGNIHLGRYGRLFAMAESTYATAPVITAANAVRHLNGELTFDPFKFKNAPDRYRTASYRRRVPQQGVAGFDLKSMAIWPSGTVGTSPEADPLFFAGMGASHKAALSTTIASGASATGATLTSGTGLQVGDCAVINVATDKPRAVYLTSVTGAVVTWAPHLPVVPSVADTFKTGVTYSLASELPNSVYLAHYLDQNGATLSREILGAAIDEITFTVDAGQESLCSFKGPASKQNRPATTSEPASFTTVGTVLPNGMSAMVQVGTATTLAKVKKIVTTLKNNEIVRMGELGQTYATDYFRNDRAMVSLAVDTYVEDPTLFYALAESNTNVAISVQVGFTQGQILFWYYPAVSVEIPQTPDSDKELSWAFKQMALDVNGNDAMTFACL